MTFKAYMKNIEAKSGKSPEQFLKPVERIQNRIKKPQAPASTTKVCPECLSVILLEAKRCAFCTSVVK